MALWRYLLAIWTQLGWLNYIGRHCCPLLGSTLVVTIRNGCYWRTSILNTKFVFVIVEKMKITSFKWYGHHSHKTAMQSKMSSRLREKKFNSLEHLKRFIKHQWATFPCEYAENLGKNMPNRCTRVIQQRGEWINH